MVYIASWQEFQEAAEDLYTKAPNTTRYCVKFRSSEGKLVLKITDNTKCIKFKTYSSIFLNRFEALNLSLMQKMQNKRAPPPPTLAAAASASDAIAKDTALDTPRATTPSVVPTPSGPASGGVKKKKPKKKK
ncbi:signal recognition particle SRP9 SRP14 subunit [Coniophora puteana RWD-64-598 SS2]|uniref:Signal recognition particle SRP9 SRP14 subunit n=1 Tax=Coniophora puteana (strain RWD-64-598) TaxID=741705 RepID=A0A5M3M7N6_CONPW|nr:signal recognition particle SRP9 SRP14 subunit [Coniophora puteana RWD-64-598 SS2]EIW74825.1 signal recognition particle SRP9 SRP14 subunit [Coniophora puteana RWD-64-598 SS2]